MKRPWYFDKTADPESLRQRAWRYGKEADEGGLKMFHSMNRLADAIEEARADFYRANPPKRKKAKAA